jgi:hypothetical protein
MKIVKTFEEFTSYVSKKCTEIEKTIQNKNF